MNNLCVGRGATSVLRSEGDREVYIRWMGVETVRCKGVDLEDAGAISDSAAVDVRDDGDVAVAPPLRLYLSASMGTEDRMGDLIDASGWILDSYRKNPVFLWAHQRSIPPIGRSVRTWVDDGGLRAIVEFAPTAFACEVAELFASGFMRGVSVGFRPVEMSRRKSSDGRDSFHFKRQELLEISAAPVPMHEDALSMCVEDSINADSAGLDEDFSELQITVGELWRLARRFGE